MNPYHDFRFCFCPLPEHRNKLNKNKTFTKRRKGFQIRIFVMCCTGMEALEGSKCSKDRNIKYEFKYYCHEVHMLFIYL